MAGRALPGLGLTGDWALGEDAWKDEMDGNLRALSVLVQGRVSEIVALEPAAPAEGAIVILDGTHATQPNNVAVYDEGAWVYIAPLEGMLLYNLADDTYYTFDGAAWTALETGGGIPQQVLTQAEYDALAVKDPATLYYIKES